MAENRLPDPDRFKLSSAQLDVWTENALEQYARDVTKVAQPRLVAIGAQPGAGKSRLSGSIAAEFVKVAAKPHISDIDALRDTHPEAPKILREHLPDFALLTNSDAYTVQYRLLEVIQNVPAHVIYDGTLKDVAGISEMVSDFRDHGYAFDFHGLIVKAHWSILGIHQRFEQAVTDGDTPRMVGVAYHDMVYEALPTAFDQIVSGLNPDVARLYNNKNETLWDYAVSAVPLLTAIAAERTRAPSLEELEVFERRWEQTMQLNAMRSPLPSEGENYQIGLSASFNQAVRFLQSTRAHIHALPSSVSRTRGL